MPSRKWVIRSLYLAFLAALAGGALTVYSWMRPEFVRQEVTKQLVERLSDVEVEMQSARLRILGGITVSNLKLIRRDDPTRTPFLFVPSAILHHDKEQLNAGKLVVNKVEMTGAQLRIERDATGKWNIADLLRPSIDGKRAPIFILHDASVTFIDRRQGDQPIAEWKNIRATIVNDPVTLITIQARGAGKPTGPFTISGQYDKRGDFSGSLDLSNIPIGGDLARTVELYSPDASEYLKPLSGKGSAHLDIDGKSGPSPKIQYDLSVKINEGRYSHPNLPLPLEHIDVAFRDKNGDITLEKASARVGDGTISLSMDLPKEPFQSAETPFRTHAPRIDSAGESTSPAPERSALQNIEDRIRSLELIGTNIALSPVLLGSLPGKAQSINEMLGPSGQLDFAFAIHRENGRLKKTLVVAPNRMEMTYRGFPYRVRNVRGKVVYTSSESVPDNIEIDLQGEGAGATVGVTGSIKGTSPDHSVTLRIAGTGVTLDDELIDAMPDDNPNLLRRLGATAFADFVAIIRNDRRLRQEYGPDATDNEFTIAVRKGSMKYAEFPYLLENLTGTLIVKTMPERPARLPAPALQSRASSSNIAATTLIFQNFHATHQGGKIHGSGRKDPAPNGSILTLNLDGETIVLNEDLHQALVAINMGNSWRSIGPSGRMNCAVRLKLFTHSDPDAPLNPAEDLEMNMAFAGASVRPNFFPYAFNDVVGRVAYSKGRVEIRDIRAKHGNSVLTLPFSEVLFRPSGGYWTDVRDMRLNPFVIDDDFLQALTPGLRSAYEGLALKGPMALHAKRIVVDDQPGPYMPDQLPGTVRGVAPTEVENIAAKPVAAQAILPTIYWDGSITMAGASMKTGVDWTDLHGKIASWGLYKGNRLNTVRGNIAFDRATVAKQPLQAVSASLRVDPKKPDVLKIPAILGKFYGGDVGGEAEVVLETPIQYALHLSAARVRLSEIAHHYKMSAKSQLEGFASAELHLSNRPDEKTGRPVLQGAGSIDVPNGKLFNLPVLLNLIKVVKLRMPDETGFEEAHTLFYIRGDRVKFGRLDLFGNAISLAGEGEMNLDGTNATFEFYPVWTKLKEMFALPGDLAGAITKQFFKIKVSGDLNGKPDYRAEPIPGIVEPVKRVLERIKK